MYLTRLRGLVDFGGICERLSEYLYWTGVVPAFARGYGRSRAFYQQNQYMEKTRIRKSKGFPMFDKDACCFLAGRWFE